MKSDTVSPIMTVKEVAEYLRVDSSTLYRLVRKGKIPAFKLGSDYRFIRDKIDQWIDEEMGPTT